MGGRNELVLVVNGSTDASLDICQALESQLDTVRVVHTEIAGWCGAPPPRSHAR